MLPTLSPQIQGLRILNSVSLSPPAGSGIVAELYRWDPSGGGRGTIPICPSGDSAQRYLYLGQNAIFRQKRPIFFRPKMAPKWPKSGQKWPKLPQNLRNKLRGGAQEIRTNPTNIGKMAKNAPTIQNKNVKMAKNRQKSSNIIKKSIFPTSTSKKGHFLPTRDSMCARLARRRHPLCVDGDRV